MKHSVIFAAISFFIGLSLFGQDSSFYQLPEALSEVSPITAPEEQLLLALSDSEYPVTPGDRFELSFQARGELTTDEIQIQSDYSLNLGIFGTIDVRGRTFEELKFQVESIVEEGYPRSFPNFSLVAVGHFQVFITGYVPRSRSISAWGLTRLSQILSSNLSPFSSIRQVRVTNRDGVTRQYDVAQALYFGNMEQDPFIKPGDRIDIDSASNIVRIQGEVQRPGVYQMLPQETLDELLQFSGGFTPIADQNVRISRQNIDGTEIIRPTGDESIQLENGDDIVVPDTTSSIPIVYIEAPFIEGPERIIHPFRSGEGANEALSLYLDNISPLADFSRARIIRNGTIIPVDLQAAIYGGDDTIVALERFDILAIPENMGYIGVTGAVFQPGQFVYRPGEDIDYYLSQAGGIDEEANNRKAYRLLGPDGSLKPRHSFLEAGDTIKVLYNDFGYRVERYLPAVSTTVGVVTTVIVIIEALDL